MIQSPVSKRSIAIDGRKTTISLEQQFWTGLKRIARERAMPLSNLLSLIDAKRIAGSNRSSAIRVFVLERVQTQLREDHATVANVPPSRLHADGD